LKKQGYGFTMVSINKELNYYLILFSLNQDNLTSLPAIPALYWSSFSTKIFL